MTKNQTLREKTRWEVMNGTKEEKIAYLRTSVRRLRNIRDRMIGRGDSLESIQEVVEQYHADKRALEGLAS